MPGIVSRLLHRDPDALPRSVRVNRALAMLDEGAVLVDVREPGACPERHSPGSRTSTSTAPSSSMAMARFTRTDRGSASGSRWSKRETMPGTSVSFRRRPLIIPPRV